MTVETITIADVITARVMECPDCGGRALALEKLAVFYTEGENASVEHAGWEILECTSCMLEALKDEAIPAK